MKVCRNRNFVNNVNDGGAVGGKSDSSDDEYCYAINNEKSPTTLIKINGSHVKVIIDTGSSVNILDDKSYRSIGSPKLSERNIPKLLPYGNTTPLNVVGKCEVVIEKNEVITLATVFVVKGEHGTLLGYSSALSLNLIKIVYNIKAADVEEKYPGIYSGIGKLKGRTVKIHINGSVKPVAQNHRRTPFHLRQKVQKEIEKLLEEDIIEKVENESTPWISPIVTAPKKDKDEIRLC
jgi:hypothetical protein